MGNCHSTKTNDHGKGVDYFSPNVNFMRQNYGELSLRKYDIWVEEVGFPNGSSFSMRQLDQLKRGI